MLVRKQTPNLLQIFCKLLLYSQVIFKSMRVPDDTFWRKSKCEWVKGEPRRRGNSTKPILIPAYLPQAKIFISIGFYRNTSAAPVCGYRGGDDGSLTVAAASVKRPHRSLSHHLDSQTLKNHPSGHPKLLRSNFLKCQFQAWNWSFSTSI